MKVKAKTILLIGALVVLPTILVPIITLAIGIPLMFFGSKEVPVSEVMQSAPSTYYSPDKKKAHPIAVKLLKDDFYWDIADENSPFGSDNGADGLAAYSRWLATHPNSSTESFLEDFLPTWQVNYQTWKSGKNDDLSMPWNWLKKYSVTTTNDIITSVAFGQLVMFGKVDEPTRKLALTAIESENSDNMIKSRGWSVPKERRERLDKMLAVMKSLPVDTTNK